MRKHAAVSKTQLRGDIDRLRTSLAHAGPIERQRLEESIHNMENDIRKFDGLPPLVRKTKPTSQELLARIAPPLLQAKAKAKAKAPVITWAQAKSLAGKVKVQSPSPSPIVSSKGSRRRIRRSEKEQRRQERERLRQEQTPAQRALAKREKTLQALDDATRRESSSLNRLKPLSSQSTLAPFAKTQSKSSSSKK